MTPQRILAIRVESEQSAQAQKHSFFLKKKKRPRAGSRARTLTFRGATLQNSRAGGRPKAGPDGWSAAVTRHTRGLVAIPNPKKGKRRGEEACAHDPILTQRRHQTEAQRATSPQRQDHNIAQSNLKQAGWRQTEQNAVLYLREGRRPSSRGPGAPKIPPTKTRTKGLPRSKASFAGRRQAQDKSKREVFFSLRAVTITLPLPVRVCRILIPILLIIRRGISRLGALAIRGNEDRSRRLWGRWGYPNLSRRRSPIWGIRQVGGHMQQGVRIGIHHRRARKVRRSARKTRGAARGRIANTSHRRGNEGRKGGESHIEERCRPAPIFWEVPILRHILEGGVPSRPPGAEGLPQLHDNVLGRIEGSQVVRTRGCNMGGRAAAHAKANFGSSGHLGFALSLAAGPAVLADHTPQDMSLRTA